VRTSATPSRTAAARRIVPTRAAPSPRTSTTRPPYQPRGPRLAARDLGKRRGARRAGHHHRRGRRGDRVPRIGAGAQRAAQMVDRMDDGRERHRPRRATRRSDPGTQSGARSLRRASVQIASDAASTSSSKRVRSASARRPGHAARDGAADRKGVDLGAGDAKLQVGRRAEHELAAAIGDEEGRGRRIDLAQPRERRGGASGCRGGGERPGSG
jgi:hypothetical protein